MTHDEFWKLIEKAKKKSEGDPDELVEVLRRSLSELPAEETVTFDAISDEYRFKAYRSELWAAASLLNGGCSDDGFEYFRAWLIAQGRRTSEDALENPIRSPGSLTPTTTTSSWRASCPSRGMRTNRRPASRCHRGVGEPRIVAKLERA